MYIGIVLGSPFIFTHRLRSMLPDISQQALESVFNKLKFRADPSKILANIESAALP